MALAILRLIGEEARKDKTAQVVAQVPVEVATYLINEKRAGKPIKPKERPKGENVVDLMEALRRSVGGRSAATEARSSGEEPAGKPAKKPRKAAAGQKEMLMPIEGKKQKVAGAKKAPTRPQRRSA